MTYIHMFGMAVKGPEGRTTVTATPRHQLQAVHRSTKKKGTARLPLAWERNRPCAPFVCLTSSLAFILLHSPDSARGVPTMQVSAVNRVRTTIQLCTISVRDTGSRLAGAPLPAQQLSRVVRLYGIAEKKLGKSPLPLSAGFCPRAFPETRHLERIRNSQNRQPDPPCLLSSVIPCLRVQAGAVGTPTPAG